jgi:hypothetical protein
MVHISPSQHASTGASYLLEHFAKVQPDDAWVVAYAPDSRECAAEIIAELRVRGVDVNFLTMRPLFDPTFADRLHDALPGSDAFSGRLVLVTLEADSMSHFKTITAELSRFAPDRVVAMRLISTGEDLMRYGFISSPEELGRRNAFLLDLLLAVKEVHITSTGGTDLHVELDSDRYDWISNRGKWRPGSFMILPAGEIATYPASISGTLVADGAINCNLFLHDDLRLGTRPVTVKVADGKAIDTQCEDGSILALIEENFSRQYGRQVGELGFGTNIGLPSFVFGNSHLNERHPGVHLGFGSHNQVGSAVDYFEPVHMDMVTDGATIEFPDGMLIDLKHFTPSEVEHPELVRDEDIVGDCCSVGYRESRVGGPTS